MGRRGRTPSEVRKLSTNTLGVFADIAVTYLGQTYEEEKKSLFVHEEFLGP